MYLGIMNECSALCVGRLVACCCIFEGLNDGLAETQYGRCNRRVDSYSFPGAIVSNYEGKRGVEFDCRRIAFIEGSNAVTMSAILDSFINYQFAYPNIESCSILAKVEISRVHSPGPDKDNVRVDLHLHRH